MRLANSSYLHEGSYNARCVRIPGAGVWHSYESSVLKFCFVEGDPTVLLDSYKFILFVAVDNAY